jgi:hypothetical protein
MCPDNQGDRIAVGSLISDYGVMRESIGAPERYSKVPSFTCDSRTGEPVKYEDPPSTSGSQGLGSLANWRRKSRYLLSDFHRSPIR